MPTRLRHVRCSVRRRTTGGDATWHTPTEDWPHLRWERFTLVPMSGGEILRVAQSGIEADWKVSGRSKPGLADEDRLVVYIDAEAEMTLEIQRVLNHGRRFIAMAKVIGPIQPVVS